VDRMGSDQAMGLRRMLGVSAPRVFCIVSSELEVDLASTLFNLAGSLQRSGSRVLVVDAFDNPQSVSALAGVPQRRTVIDGLRLGKDLREAVVLAGQVHFVTLRRNTWGATAAPALGADEKASLESAVKRISEESDVVLVDGRLGADGLPVALGSPSAQLVVRMTANADALKRGYALLKGLVSMLRPQRVGVILVGADDRVGAKVFENLARAATQYLGIELVAIGTIPADPIVAQANSLRRSVVEAFPQSEGAAAFRRLAGNVLQLEVPA
jgi:flagellar biosynthesis protein FlhG